MTTLWLTLFLLALTFLPVGAIRFWHKRLADTRRSPLKQKLLRGPGESGRNDMENALWELQTYLMLFPMIPLCLLTIYLWPSCFDGVPLSLFGTTLFIVAGVIAEAIILFRIRKYWDQLRKSRQGYEGEVAVAQELNQLMREGAYVFHDVPAENFNIDHVVIGRNGVFAVETKSRMKPIRNRGGEDAKVVFDGRSLCFPGWEETEPLEQASRQARWLAQWLSHAVASPVEVKPVLALPGWYVKRTNKSRENVIVLYGNPQFLLSKITFSSPITEAEIKRIAYQLEQKCRDVQPSLCQRQKNSG